MTPPVHEVVLTGDDGRRQATALLQRIRLRWPRAGCWEAADLQWWWRRPRCTDAEGQLFWLDHRDEPLAAVVRTEFSPQIQADVFVVPGDPGLRRTVWERAIGRALTADPDRTQFPVASADSVLAQGPLARAGFRPTPQTVVASWLGARDRPALVPLPPGYRLFARTDRPGRPHPMAARNGPAIAVRLGQCSLYRPELDLVIDAPDGTTAAYGLFWADPVTGVGLVEPMRTEDGHQGRGIASHLLAAGLHLLSAAGCDRLKVSNDLGLYRLAGFVPLRHPAAVVYARQPGRHGGPDTPAAGAGHEPAGQDE
jgi:GNAT superfamily N-acetyltransferase